MVFKFSHLPIVWIAKLSEDKHHKTVERDTVLVTFYVSGAELGECVICFTHVLASVL